MKITHFALGLLFSQPVAASLPAGRVPTRAAPKPWKADVVAMPKPQPRLRHRAPAALTADAAHLEFEVWPLGTRPPGAITWEVVRAGKITGKGQGTLKPEQAGRYSLTVPAASFRPGRQRLRYRVNGQAWETGVVGFGRPAPLWTDDFDGAALDPRWMVEIPISGPAVEERDNALTITVPANRAFDQWVPANEAPRILRPVPAGDWSFTLTLRTDGLPASGNYQAGVAVQLGPNDFAFFGPFQGHAVTLERSGENGLYTSPFASASTPEVELRVRKAGETLWFDWRPSGGLWSSPTALPAPNEPVRAGLIVKTWAPIGVHAAFTRAVMETMSR